MFAFVSSPHPPDTAGRKSSPLHFAAGFGRRDVVDHLLVCGASVHARDDGGLIPLHNACSFGHAEVICRVYLPAFPLPSAYLLPLSFAFIHLSPQVSLIFNLPIFLPSSLSFSLMVSQTFPFSIFLCPLQSVRLPPFPFAFLLFN